MEKNLNLEKWSSMDITTDYLGVSRENVLQWISNRNMPAHKTGILWKFKISEVDEWIRSGGAAEKPIDCYKEIRHFLSILLCFLITVVI